MPTRRTFLRRSAALAPFLAAPSAPAAPPGTGGGIIDCHTHFYDPTRPEGVPWPGKDSPLHRTVLPEDWMAVAGTHGVTGTVVVEASPWVEDNQWLLDLADRDSRILGVIGNLDPGAPGFPALLERFAAHPLYRGIRINAKSAEHPAPGFHAGLDRLAAAGRVLDVNGGPVTPGIVAGLAERHRDLTVILNHCGNPGNPAQPLPDIWHEGIRAAGTRPNVFCKVSALVEGVRGEPGQAPADPAFYRPILDPVWDAFGPERVIYGSNWPVSDRGAPYATVIGIVTAYFQEKGPAVAKRYFSTNSRTAYGWEKRKPIP